jgi:hypothetical protein
MKKLTYIGRKPSASPAAGSHDQHHHEQHDIIERALGIGTASKDVRDAKPMDMKVVDGKSSPDGKPASAVEVVVAKEGK